MKLWKDFRAAAAGKTVLFTIPGVYDNGLELEPDTYEITDEALIWTDPDGNRNWLALARIAAGCIVMPAAEE